MFLRVVSLGGVFPTATWAAGASSSRDFDLWINTGLFWLLFFVGGWALCYQLWEYRRERKSREVKQPSLVEPPSFLFLKVNFLKRFSEIRHGNDEQKARVRAYEQGFSIVELLIAAGLLAGMSVGLLKLMEGQQKSMNFAQSRSAEFVLLNEIRSTLIQKEACERTLQGMTPDSDVSTIRGPNGNTRFEVGQDYDNTIRLVGLSLENVDVPIGGMGNARLSVSMERLARENVREAPIRWIDLQVATDDSGSIVECFADSDNTIETALEEACASIGGEFDADTRLCSLAEYSQAPESHLAVSTQYLDEHSLEMMDEIFEEVDENYVHVEGDVMTGDLEVQANITAQVIDADQVTANIFDGDEFCIDDNCRTTFAEQSCAVGEVIMQINEDGTVECANVTCPDDAEFYVGINSNGNVLCKPFPTETCPADHYVDRVYEDGSVDCRQVPETERISGQNCGTGQVVTGIASNGDLECEEDLNVYGRSCPQTSTSTKGGTVSSPQYLIGHDNNGDPICIPQRDLTFATGSVTATEASTGGWVYSYAPSCPSGYRSVSVEGYYPCVCTGSAQCDFMGVWNDAAVANTIIGGCANVRVHARRRCIRLELE